jgi:adenosylhomocysteine nucleosidase
MPEVAIIAALEREIWPLVKSWRVCEQAYSGRHFRVFEAENCVAVCGGIGPAAARRAAEAMVALYQPGVLESVGFAGALDSKLQVGDVLEMRKVIDAADGSCSDTGRGDSTLVSFSSVAGEEQKAKLAKSYRAGAVDMEAAAVSKSAQAHRLQFRAIKVISDEKNFPMPPMERFVTNNGQFQSGKFAMYIALRPWMWATAMRLGRDSAKASRALSEHLRRHHESVHAGSQPVAATASEGSRP